MSLRRRTGQKGYLLTSEGLICQKSVRSYKCMIEMHLEQTSFRQLAFVAIVVGAFILYGITSFMAMVRSN